MEENSNTIEFLAITGKRIQETPQIKVSCPFVSTCLSQRSDWEVRIYTVEALTDPDPGVGTTRGTRANARFSLHRA